MSSSILIAQILCISDTVLYVCMYTPELHSTDVSSVCTACRTLTVCSEI